MKFIVRGPGVRAKGRIEGTLEEKLAFIQALTGSKPASDAATTPAEQEPSLTQDGSCADSGGKA